MFTGAYTASKWINLGVSYDYSLATAQMKIALDATETSFNVPGANSMFIDYSMTLDYVIGGFRFSSDDSYGSALVGSLR